MSPKALRAHRDALVLFHNVYIEYLNEVVHGNGVSPQRAEILRGEVIRRIPAAQAALDVAGVRIAFTPPPAVGGPILYGLPNVAFAHEQPGFRLHEFAGIKPTYADVIDWTRLGAQYLEDREERERRRRRNPLYWPDRVFRGTLGIPSYLVSAIVGVPRARIEGSGVGMFLRAVAVAADGATLWGAGKLIGWY